MKKLYGKKKSKPTARERFNKAIENFEAIHEQVKVLYKKQEVFREAERLAMLDVFEEEELLVGIWQVEPWGTEGLALVGNRKSFDKLVKFLIVDPDLQYTSFSLAGDGPSANVSISPETVEFQFDAGASALEFISRYKLKIKTTFMRKYLKECQDNTQAVIDLLAKFPEK